MGGVSLNHSLLTISGLKYDRRWMLVDVQNRFISQREFPELCLFTITLSETYFTVTFKDDEINIPFAAENASTIEATIWDDTVRVIAANWFTNKWFSNKLYKEVKLVYQPLDSLRTIDAKSANKDEVVSLADGYPILVIGEPALNLLNEKVGFTIPVNQFRPNILFTGGESNDEDFWKCFIINKLLFKGVKPCARCVITTINQQSGEKSLEPLRTLSTYRKVDNKIIFGQNVIGPSKGSIRVGDTINITSKV